MEQLLTNMMAEFQSKAKIPVVTDRLLFMLSVGPMATIADGAYHQPYKGMEILFIIPTTDLVSSIKTFLHEISHATGHRLGRKMEFYTYKDPDYAKEEVIAETSALHLLNHFGLVTDDVLSRSNTYINTYAKSLSSTQIDKAQDKAVQAANYVLTHWLAHTSYQRKAA